MLKLYRHQNEGVDHLLRDHPERFRSIVMPTAAGKTAVIQVAAHQALSRSKDPVRSVLVVTPMEHIEDAFASKGVFGFKASGATRSSKVTIQEDFWLRLREMEGSTSIPDRLREILKSSSPEAILTTHAQIVRCYKQHVLPDNLEGRVLAVDEGHRSGEELTLLFALMDAWYERGGIVWSVTATPFRGDGRRIAPAHVEPLVYTYSELADAGVLPKVISFQVLQIPTPGRPKDYLLDGDVEAVADIIAAQPDRRTLVRIPSGGSVDLAERFIQALLVRGYGAEEILNAVGVQEAVKQKMLSTLLEERQLARGKGYAATKIKVIISCKRMAEGADWVTCSRVVSLGLSTSLAVTIQLLGRGARSKRGIKGFPAGLAEEVSLVVFVPQLEEGEDLLQVQRLMQIACALQCSDVLYDFERFWLGLVKDFRLPPQTRISSAQLGRIGNVSIEETADARLLGVQAAHTLRQIHGTVPTLGEVWALLERWQVPHSFRTLSELVAAASVQDPLLRADVEAAMALVCGDLQQRMQHGVTDAPDLKAAYEDLLHDHLVALAHKYRHLSVDIDLQVATGLQGVLTPRRMSRIVQDLTAARDAVFDLTDEAVIRTFVDPYRERYGVDPSARRASAKDLAKLTASQVKEADYDRYLRRTGFCLPRLVVCREWIVGPPLDVGELRQKLKPAHLSRLKPQMWANATSLVKAQYSSHLDVSRLFGRPEHLVGLELAAQRGWRGLPGGETLASILG